jgi:hypothetical protein
MNSYHNFLKIKAASKSAGPADHTIETIALDLKEKTDFGRFSQNRFIEPKIHPNRVLKPAQL